MIRYAFWFVVIHSTNAATELPPLLGRKIPECAQECVLSFLTVNYNSIEHASLATLCSKTGPSGFTLGEGAVQCVTAERRMQYCSDEEVDDDVVDSAYGICDGVDGAVRPTHGVITAVLQGSPDGGPMTFPPVALPSISSTSSSTETTSTSMSTHKTSTSTSEQLSTAEPTSTTLTTQLTTASMTKSTASPSSVLSASPSPSPSATSTDASTSTRVGESMSPGKIAGISAGAVSGFAALIGLFFLARCLLRRRRHNSFLQNQYHPWTSPDRGEKGFHVRSNSDDLPHKWFPTIRPVPPTIKPYKRDSYRTSAIGLAVSQSARTSPELTRNQTPQPQPQSQSQPQHQVDVLPRSRPVSKLLPDKPDLPPLPTHIMQTTPPRLTPPPEGQYKSLLQSTVHGQAAKPSEAYSPTIRTLSYEPPTLQIQSATPSTSHTQQTSFNHFQHTQQTPTNNIDRAVPSLLPKIYIPKRGEAPKSLTSSPPPAIHPRQSVITEFEEDAQASSSSSGALRAVSPAGQTWVPPSAGPLSPAYVADGNGNWRLRKTSDKMHNHDQTSSGDHTQEFAPDYAASKPEPSQAQCHTQPNLSQDHAQSSISQCHTRLAAAAAGTARDEAKPIVNTASAASPTKPHTSRSPAISSLRLSKATMPSPLFRQGKLSPRSASQPTTTATATGAPTDLYPAPLQTRSSSASATQPRQSHQSLSPVAESPKVRQYPGKSQAPTHCLYNPYIPHSTTHPSSPPQQPQPPQPPDDRSLLPSHFRRPPSSNIRHNYPLHPSLRAGPGPNPLGVPLPLPRAYYPIYPPQQVQMHQNTQQKYQRQPYQNQVRNYPYPAPPAPTPLQSQSQSQSQPQPHPHPQLQSKPYSQPYPQHLPCYPYQTQQPTNYPGSPQSLQSKRLGPNATAIKIDSPSLSGDPRWRRQADAGIRSSATPSTAIPWIDQ